MCESPTPTLLFQQVKYAPLNAWKMCEFLSHFTPNFLPLFFYPCTFRTYIHDDENFFKNRLKAKAFTTP